MDVQSIPAVIKSSLLAVHLLGIVFGLGAATMLDLILVRFVGSRTVTDESWSVISLLSKAVTGGLALLWASGIGFLTHYMIFNPTLLTNPKVWAKIAIVGVLSLNGYFIHRIVLPLVRRQVGARLFEGLTNFQRSGLLASGAISGMSWWIPLGLGAFPQLNFTVGAETILGIYALLLILAIVIASLIVRLVLPRLASVTSAPTEYGGRAGAPPNSRFVDRRRFAHSEWLRPAALAVLALATLGLSYVYVVLQPVDQAARPSEPAGFELASSAEPATLERRTATDGQRVAEVPSWAAAIYEPSRGTAESQSNAMAQPDTGARAERPAPTLHDNEAHANDFYATESHANDQRRPPPQAPAKADFVGIWGANASACSPNSQSVSNPAAVINEGGATAGEISCAFERMRFDGSSWRTVAKCSDGRESWTSAVRLSVKNDRLTWEKPTWKRNLSALRPCDDVEDCAARKFSITDQSRS